MAFEEKPCRGLARLTRRAPIARNYFGGAGAAPAPRPEPSSTFPSASVTETKIPPGSPVRIGFSVTLTLSPALSVLDFQPERTRYGGGFISIDHRVAPFASVTSRSIQECGF